MPSASVKTDSNGSQECTDPVGRLGQLMEKKIRNLEKRKTKLENYKEELNNGKILNDDQQKAVAAYDSVITSLELCREFSNQIEEVASENVKFIKQQLKKQQEDKAKQELERVKQVLKLQSVLTRLGQEDVRADFLAGTNGALTLTEEKLLLLDEIYQLITPTTNEKINTNVFKTHLQTSAENLVNLLDGKNKSSTSGTSFKEMRGLIQQIANCNYPKKTKSRDTSTNTTSPSPEEQQPDKPTTKSNKRSKDKSKTAVSNGTLEQAEKIIDAKPVVDSGVPTPPTDTTPVILAKEVEPVPLAVAAPVSSVNKPSISEGPPPGICAHPVDPTSLSTPQELNQPHPRLSSVLPPEPSIVPQVSTASLNQSQMVYSRTQPDVDHTPSLEDINDLVTSGSSFNFLQESQVKPDQAVYIDPAVVSFGSIKPDSLVQLHKQQSISPTVAGLEVTNIPSETFINQTFSSSGITGYSQSVPSYTSNVGGGVGAPNPSAMPPPIPLPSQTPEKTNFIQPESQRFTESSSWAEQSSHMSPTQEEGWGDLGEGPVNGDDNNVWDSGDRGESSMTWGEESDTSKTYHQDMDRRSSGGYNSRGGNRGRNRGSGGFRGGNRGGSFGFPNGGRGGGSGYGGSYRSRGPTNNGGGFRGGRGNFSRGNGGSNPPRGGGFRNRGYQGNQPRNQF